VLPIETQDARTILGRLVERTISTSPALCC
jgi:hypothetical protein